MIEPTAEQMERARAAYMSADQDPLRAAVRAVLQRGPVTREMIIAGQRAIMSLPLDVPGNGPEAYTAAYQAMRELET